MSRVDTIADLKKLLAELEEERDELDEQIRSVRNTVNIAESRTEPTSASSQQAQVLRNSIYDILSEHHPLHRQTICHMLIERGFTIRGKDPVSTVGAHLSKDARFANVGKGQWDLDERYGAKIKATENDNVEAIRDGGSYGLQTIIEPEWNEPEWDEIVPTSSDLIPH